MSIRGCLYTVMVGDYCDVIDPGLVPSGWDRLCVTDNPDLRSPHWDMLPVPNPGSNRVEDAKMAKFYKTCPWELPLSLCGESIRDRYDVLMYIDARITIVRELAPYLAHLEDYDFVFMRHNSCISILEHFKVLLKHGYESPEMIEKIKEHYAQAGYAYDNGFIGGGVLLFRNNDRSRKFMRDWWNEISQFSHRDQASASFALFLNPELNYVMVDNPIYTKPPYFAISGKRHHPRLKVVNE